MIFDLHTHTHCSDGALPPSELLARAIEKGVEVLAVTDHDTLDAYRELPGETGPLRLVHGIEFSTEWEHTGIHVVGLDFDPDSSSVRSGVDFQTNARMERARRIAEVLQKRGVPDALPGAAALARGGYIGRPHFAQYLVDIGKAKSLQAAFRQYVGDGTAANIRQHWAAMPQVVRWIRESGGIAVLAHPLKYKMTRSRLKRLLAAFAQAGGQALEVVSGQQNPQQTASLGELCTQMNLLASCGSDFHAPGARWSELGAFAPLPAGVVPVWERFS
jgi:predicted metal-dependent phosphoesterase TrpH